MKRSSIVKGINKTVSFAKGAPLCARFPALHLSSIKVLGISDASFASNSDLTSHLGYLVFLGDARGRVAPIHFKSYKARRVTRSVLSAELIAFSDVFDTAYTLAEEIKTALSTQKVSICLFTDSKSLLDVISKGTRTAEKRVMLDISCPRQVFQRNEISDVRYVRSNQNLADGLTKKMKQEAIREVFQTGEWKVEPEQWIIKDKKETQSKFIMRCQSRGVRLSVSFSSCLKSKRTSATRRLLAFDPPQSPKACSLRTNWRGSQLSIITPEIRVRHHAVVHDIRLL